MLKKNEQRRGIKVVSMKGGDLLIECLKVQGVRCVFGMPGVQNLQIYDAIFRNDAKAIDHYLVRHEYGATLMAHGFARTTGDVGVALTVSGPGATKAATGLLEAFTDCLSRSMKTRGRLVWNMLVSLVPLAI